MVELSFIAESDFSLHDTRVHVPRRQPSARLQALVRCLVGENQNVNAALRPSKP